MHDQVFCDVSFVVYEHESIESGQELCGLGAISIKFIGVDTFESACFIFLIFLGKIFKGKGVISSAVRMARRFVANCSG